MKCGNGKATARLRERGCAALVAAAAVGGCTHTVEPPAGGDRPTKVYLLDHGRTSSVVLPQDDALVRYAYGEWDWYARNRTGLVRGSGALFRSTQGALGRQVVDAASNLAAVRAAVRVPVEAAWALDVPGKRVHALANSLENLFQRWPGEPVDNPRVALRFVAHPEEYSLGNNSNHMTASWLRRMGCRVITNGPWSRWEVLPPGSGGLEAARVPGPP